MINDSMIFYVHFNTREDFDVYHVGGPYPKQFKAGDHEVIFPEKSKGSGYYVGSMKKLEEEEALVLTVI